VRFGERAVRGPELTLPHPGLDARDFWRREMAELEPAAQRGHPGPDRA
jgi:7,8-dihydro-6-hydroxymethylpterin-pyrophosphokinase